MVSSASERSTINILSPLKTAAPAACLTPSSSKRNFLGLSPLANQERPFFSSSSIFRIFCQPIESPKQCFDGVNSIFIYSIISRNRLIRRYCLYNPIYFCSSNIHLLFKMNFIDNQIHMFN